MHVISHSNNRLSQCLIAAILSCCLSCQASAEVVTDGTLGAAQNLPGPVYNITSDLGQQRGNNLFHSFTTFNVESGNEAAFSGPAAVTNIISRVTGGSFSSIEGTISSSIPDANLFLLNPAGILFGAGAAVDVDGSFHASTADSLLFENGERLSVNTQVPAVLSVAEPSAFGFLGTNVGGIIVDSAIIATDAGEDLSLTAQGISINNSILLVDQAQLALNAALSGGDVAIDANDSNQNTAALAGSITATASLLASEDSAAGEIVIRGGEITLNNTDVTVRSFNDGAGGTLTVAADLLRVNTGSELTATTFGDNPGGTIDVTANTVVLDGSLAPTLLTGILADAVGAGAGGTIMVSTTDLFIFDGAEISAETLGSGDGGEITINANQTVIDSSRTTEFTGIRVAANDSGAGGDLLLNTSLLGIVNGGLISASTVASGDSGGLVINADIVTLIGDGFPTGIFAESGGVGEGGDITINTTELNVFDGARISATTFNAGQGGEVSITATNILLDNRNDLGLTGIFADAISDGNGGSLLITSDTLVISPRTEISAEALGFGDGGDIEVNAGLVFLDGVGANGIFTGIRVTARDVGAGGDLLLNADVLGIFDGAQLSASTLGDGDAGVVTLDVGDIIISGADTGIFAAVEENASGQGGDILLSAGTLDISAGGQVSTSTFGAGNGGLLSVSATNLVIDGVGLSTGLFATVENRFTASGNGGDLLVDVQDLHILNGGRILASTFGFGTGNGGTATINIGTGLIDGTNASVLTAISASTETFGVTQGGDVNITAGDLTLLNGAQISAGSTGAGSGGSLSLTADNLTLSGVGRFSAGIFVPAQGTGDAGDIDIRVGNLLVENGAIISASTTGPGNSGTLTINADSVRLDGQGRRTGIQAEVRENASGLGGNVSLTTGLLELSDGGVISASTIGSGEGGTINATVSSAVFDNRDTGIFTGITASTSSDTGADGGDVNIQADDLSLFGSSLISVSSFAAGDGGVLTIDSASLVLDGRQMSFSAGLFASANGTGSGGDISLNIDDLQVLNGARISASTFDQGDSGLLSINADSILIDGNGQGTSIRATVGSLATGQGGDIQITADELQIFDGGSITAATFGAGPGGTLSLSIGSGLASGLNADVFTGISASTEFDGFSEGGDLNIVAGDLTLLDSAQITVSSFGDGPGGTLTLTADSLTLSGVTDFSAGVFATAQDDGDGGDVLIDVGTLQITNGGRISASTFDFGDSGVLNINADVAILDGQGIRSGIFAEVDEFGFGAGGDINFTAGSLSILDGALISAQTSGFGEGGAISINAMTMVIDDSLTSAFTGVTASTEVGSFADGGDITIIAGDISVFNTGTITASSFSLGDGGVIDITATNLTLDGFQGDFSAGIFASVSDIGDGGDILINADNLLIRNQATISASSFGTIDPDIPFFTPGDAGDITITANAVRLVNTDAGVTTQADDAEGGNVTMVIQDSLVMLNGDISATVGGGQGNGGNIDIDPVFVIMLGDSTITANAVGGNGGNINIVSEFFLIGPNTAITASSQFGVQGSVQISSPQVDISDGLVEFGESFQEVDVLLDKPCVANSDETQSSFVVLGKDAILVTPDELSQSESQLLKNVTVNTTEQTSTISAAPFMVASTCF